MSFQWFATVHSVRKTSKEYLPGICWVALGMLRQRVTKGYPRYMASNPNEFRTPKARSPRSPLAPASRRRWKLSGSSALYPSLSCRARRIRSVRFASLNPEEVERPQVWRIQSRTSEWTLLDPSGTYSVEHSTVPQRVCGSRPWRHVDPDSWGIWTWIWSKDATRGSWPYY